MENEQRFTLKTSENDALNAGKTITRFAPRDQVTDGATVSLAMGNTVSSGTVVAVNGDTLYGDKVVCTIKKR